MSESFVNVGKTCAVEECEKPAKARGYCQGHYMRLHNYGDPLGEPALRSNRNKGKICAVEGCNEGARSRGWCIPHYGRWQQYGDPEAGGPLRHPKASVIKERQLCAWEGCKELERARGFCASHYQRVRYNAAYEHLLPEYARAPRCIAPKCENPQYIKGFCHSHDDKRRRGQNPLEEADVEPVDYKTFGGRLFALRASRGWSLQDVASRVGLTRERIRQLEKQAEPPQTKTIAKLANALEVNVSALIGEQLPTDVGTEVKERRVASYKFMHLPCLWCGGDGTLPISNGHTPVKTVCAYCKGSGAIYINPAPSLPDAQVKETAGKAE